MYKTKRNKKKIKGGKTLKKKNCSPYGEDIKIKEDIKSMSAKFKFSFINNILYINLSYFGQYFQNTY